MMKEMATDARPTPANRPNEEKKVAGVAVGNIYF